MDYKKKKKKNQKKLTCVPIYSWVIALYKMVTGQDAKKPKLWFQLDKSLSQSYNGTVIFFSPYTVGWKYQANVCLNSYNIVINWVSKILPKWSYALKKPSTPPFDICTRHTLFLVFLTGVIYGMFGKGPVQSLLIEVLTLAEKGTCRYNNWAKVEVPLALGAVKTVVQLKDIQNTAENTRM